MDGKFWANISLCCLLLITFIVGVQTLKGTSVTKLLQPDVKISAEAKDLLNQVKLTRFGIRLKKGENKVDGLFSFENTSEYAIRNIEIICDPTDATGRSLGRHKWLVSETVEMLSKKTLLTENNRMFIPSKASHIECSIVDMDIVDEPMITVSRSHGSSSQDGAKPKHSSPEHH